MANENETTTRGLITFLRVGDVSEVSGGGGDLEKARRGRKSSVRYMLSCSSSWRRQAFKKSQVRRSVKVS